MNSYYTKNELENIGFNSIGKNVLISKKSSIYSPEKINIGSNVRIDDFAILTGEINIGNYVHIASFTGLFGSYGIEMEDFTGVSSRVSIYSSSDDYSGSSLTNPMVPDKYKSINSGKVCLKKHSIVGASSVILPGVVIGNGSSIGAMTLVSKSTKDWKIYFGIPAKPIKNRKKDLLRLEKELKKECDI